MQISTKPAIAKKIISASLPTNISAADKLALETEWNEKARIREEAIAKETKVPEEFNLKLKFEIRRFGRFWNSYAQKKNKMVPLLPCPSLFSSAIDALTDKMEESIRS